MMATMRAQLLDGRHHMRGRDDSTAARVISEIWRILARGAGVSGLEGFVEDEARRGG